VRCVYSRKLKRYIARIYIYIRDEFKIRKLCKTPRPMSRVRVYVKTSAVCLSISSNRNIRKMFIILCTYYYCIGTYVIIILHKCTYTPIGPFVEETEREWTNPPRWWTADKNDVYRAIHRACSPSFFFPFNNTNAVVRSLIFGIFKIYTYETIKDLKFLRFYAYLSLVRRVSCSSGDTNFCF